MNRMNTTEQESKCDQPTPSDRRGVRRGINGANGQDKGHKVRKRDGVDGGMTQVHDKCDGLFRGLKFHCRSEKLVKIKLIPIVIMPWQHMHMTG